MRRALCVAGLVALAASCAASAATAPGKPKQPTLKITPAHFTMKWTQCKQLPEGLVVTGQGKKHYYNYTTTDAEGVTHDYEINIIVGRATDNKGGTYYFDYHDTLSGNFVTQPFVALFTDHFSLVPLSGSTVNVHSFFTAKAHVGKKSFAFDPPFAVPGDPIRFRPYAPHCDPL